MLYRTVNQCAGSVRQSMGDDMGVDLSVVIICLCAALALAAEFRGAYVTSWNKGFRTPEEVDLTVQAAKTAGLNALVVEVRKVGDAYYQTDLEPIGSEVPDDFDPLAYTIEKAHAEGMQVHAWLVVYRVWRDSDKPEPGHILADHPEWASLNFDGELNAEEGVYIDPGIPEYREHFANLCADIAKRYAVDGIHYDYVRYPNRQWGYAQIALDRYFAEVGATEKPSPHDPKWLQWRRDQVTALVALVRERVKAINPEVKIQASTIAWGECTENFEGTRAYNDCCQDWRLWMENGLIDENCPMVYGREFEETGAAYFRSWIDGTAKWSYGLPAYVALASMWNNAEQLLSQIDVIRNAGLAGWVLFAFDQSEQRAKKSEDLGKSLYPAPQLSTRK